MSQRNRATIAIVGVVVIVVAFFLLRGSSSNDTSSTASSSATTTTRSAPSSASSTPATAKPVVPATPTVRVVGGQPQGGLQKLEFQKGGTVKFRVASDTAGEIHVHGYDFHKDVAKGGTVTFDFPAKIDGRFVVELEASSTQIAELDVNP